MATHDVVTTPSWSLQRKQRSTLATDTPASQSAIIFDAGNFAKWTNVPPIGVADPFIADQVRSGRRVLTGPVSHPAPEPFGGGKRCVGPHHGEPQPAGKRGFPDLVGARSTAEMMPRGLKRVPTRARSDEPASANPNGAVAGVVKKPESVKMFHGTNQVRCKIPTHCLACQRAAALTAPFCVVVRELARHPIRWLTFRPSLVRRRFAGQLPLLDTSRAGARGEGRLELEPGLGLSASQYERRGEAEARA